MKAVGRRDAFAVLGLAALSAVFLWPLLSLKNTYYQEDFSVIILPYFHWLHGHFSAGTFPGWSQGILCGYPYYDEGLSGVFYPPLRLLLARFDAIEGMALFYGLHIFWSGCGAYLLARLQGLDEPASFFAGVMSAFCGGVVFSLHSWIVLVSLAWLPWMLAGLRLCLDAARPARLAGAALLGLGVAGSFLGGHVGILLYELALLGLMLAAWIFQAEGGAAKAARRAAPALAGALLVSALLGSGQALATARYWSQSVRSVAFSYAQASENSLSPASFLNFLLPYAYGAYGDASFLGMSWKYGSWLNQGMLLYMGIPGLLLALVGLFERPRLAWPYGAAALLLVLYALGPATPLHGWIYHLPVFGNLRAPMKAAILVAPCLAMPAAWGLQSLAQDAARRRALAGLLLAMGLLGGAAALCLHWGGAALMAKGKGYIEAKVLHSAFHPFPLEYYLEKLGRWMRTFQRQLGFQALWSLAAALLLFKAPSKAVWALSLLLFGELCQNGAAYHPVVGRELYDREPAIVSFIKAREGAGPAPYRVLSWGWSERLKACFPKGRMGGDLAGERRLAALLGGDLNLLWGLDAFRGYTPVGISRFQSATEGLEDFLPGDVLAQNTAKLLARRQAWNDGGVKYLLSAVELKAPGLKLIRGEDGLRLYQNLQARPLARFAPPARGSAAFTRYDDGAWELDCRSPAGGDLLLSRAYYEGLWSAELDGKPAALAPDGAFCKLALGPGRHALRVFYRDPGYARAEAAHAAGWALAAILLTLAWFQRRKHV
jgi:hypothetical protein